MDLIPLLSTTAGAAIALGGAIIVDLVRGRDASRRDSQTARKSTYLEFTLALGRALQELRETANSGLTDAARLTAIDEGLSAAGLFAAREKMLMVAARWVLRPAEAAFERLIEVRDAVRADATTSAAAYHDAYHPYAEQMWRLRNAIRSDLGASQMSPSDLERRSWEDREKCARCAHRAAGNATPEGAVAARAAEAQPISAQPVAEAGNP